MLYRKFGGIMLNDASWDYEKKQNDGSMYSHTISNILNGRMIDTASTQTSQKHEPPVEKPKPIIRVINGRNVIYLRGKIF